MSTLRSRRAVPLVLGAVLSALVMLGAVSSCGLFTAAVSVPEAFTHNNDLGLAGTITDDLGVPVDDVQVTIKREYYLWHATESYSEFDTSTRTENHAFTIPTRRAHELTFTFRHKGYLDQTLIVRQHGIAADDPWIAGSIWPLQKHARVMLQKADRQAAPLRWLAVDVDWTDPQQNPVIDLSQLLPTSADPGLGFSREHTMELSRAAVHTLRLGDAVPPGCLMAIIRRQPAPAAGPAKPSDRLDLNLPERFSLQISGAEKGDGFMPDVPQAGGSPLAQMLEAPQQYVPSLELYAKGLRTMRDSADPSVEDRNAFFYIHARGMYGKGVIHWDASALADPAAPLRFSIVLIFQPDGTRGMPLRNGI